MGDDNGGFFKSKAFRNIVRIVGILVALACCAISVLGLFSSLIKVNPIQIIISVYIVILAFLAIAAELKIMFILKWFFFMAPFVGLGLYYIFFSVLLFTRDLWYNYLVGAVGIALGVIYCIFGCIGLKRIDGSDDVFEKQKKKAEKRAVSSAVNQAEKNNTAENRQALSNAAQAENGQKKSNPFDNDNPFNGNSAY